MILQNKWIADRNKELSQKNNEKNNDMIPTIKNNTPVSNNFLKNNHLCATTNVPPPEVIEPLQCSTSECKKMPKKHALTGEKL